MGQRLTTMTSGQARFPDRPIEIQVRPAWRKRHVGERTVALDGEDGRRHVLHPQHAHRGHQSRAGDRFMQTGNQITGRPCLGSWASYGLGSLNDNLPTFVVLVARADEHRASRRQFPRGCGRPDICPANMPGVSFRSGGRSDPVHQQSAGRAARGAAAIRSMGCKQLNELTYRELGDPETHTRIQQYELAFRMQASVPELTEPGR